MLFKDCFRGIDGRLSLTFDNGDDDTDDDGIVIVKFDFDNNNR